MHVYASLAKNLRYMPLAIHLGFQLTETIRAWLSTNRSELDEGIHLPECYSDSSVFLPQRLRKYAKI